MGDDAFEAKRQTLRLQLIVRGVSALWFASFLVFNVLTGRAMYITSLALIFGVLYFLTVLCQIEAGRFESLLFDLAWSTSVASTLFQLL
jgi:hypothetical protein